MNLSSSFLRSSLFFLKSIINQLNLFLLRLKGVTVHSSAVVHPFAVIQPSGGSISIGAGTFVDRGVIMRALGGNISIGKDCSINAYSVIYGGGGLVIGNDVLIATHTLIIPSNHIFRDSRTLIRNQGLSLKGIVIEDDVWLGAGCRILDGVRIAKGTVVGSGAVVTRSTDPYVIVAGIPACMISKRDSLQ